MAEALFDLTPFDVATGEGVSVRTLRERRLANLRVAKMHGRHGHGPADQACRGCRHLIHSRPGARAFLKCELYGITQSESSDWRAKWPACGQFQKEQEL